MSNENAEGGSIAEFVYTTLRAAIQQGHYTPGERLTTVGLAETLGVSRTPVRAALTRLKSEGLVDSTDGRAARIPTLTVQAVEEAYEITGALESMLVERVATTASEDELASITGAVEAMEDAAAKGDQAAWAAADELFHRLVRDYAGREVAVSMLRRVETVIDRVRFLSLNLKPEGAKASTVEHRQVLDALIARDGATAKERHATHLRRVQDETVTFLSNSFPAFGGAPFSGRVSAEETR